MVTERFINIGVIVIGQSTGKVIKLKDRRIAALKHCRIKGLFYFTLNKPFYWERSVTTFFC